MNRGYDLMRAIGQQHVPKGFTLLELMVTIIIVAVLSAFAMPSMSRMLLKHRVQDAASDVFVALLKTRSEAIKRNADISLQPVTAGDWTSGWQIPDPVNSGKYLDAHQPLINISASLTGTSPDAYPIYNSAGRLKNGTPVFIISASTGNYSCSYKVTVDPSGRPYEKSTGVNGTDVVTGGGAPTC